MAVFFVFYSVCRKKNLFDCNISIFSPLNTSKGYKTKISKYAYHLKLKFKYVTLMKNLFRLSLIAVALSSCAGSASQSNEQSGSSSSPDSSTSFVVPPCQNAKLNSESIAFLNEAGSVSQTQRGTMVIVPENAFVFEDGTPVKGEVKVEIKEIFTPAEIILSGIPMNVENNGKIEPFISDGMFDIRASANAKPVKIAEGKSLTICNESNKNNSDFDYWYFDEKQGKWDNIGDRGQTATSDEVQKLADGSNPTMSKQFVSMQSPQQTAKPAANSEANYKPVPVSKGKSGQTNQTKPDKEITNLSGDDYVFSLYANLENYPELSSYKNVIWRALKPLTTPEEKAFESSIMQAGSNIELKCVNEDRLIYELNYGGQTMQIAPILTDGGAKAKAQFAEMNKNYQLALKERNNEINRQIRMAEVAQKAYNVFSVMRLGIYNCDRFYSSPKTPGLFVLLKNNIELKQNIYAILEKNEGIVALSPAYLQNGRYKIPSKDVAGFIHIDSEGLIYKQTHIDNNKMEYDMKLESTGLFADKNGALEMVIKSL